MVRSTAATVSPMPAMFGPESRSPSHSAPITATTAGAAAPRMPALMGLVYFMPQNHTVVLPTSPVSERTRKGAWSGRRKGGKGPCRILARRMRTGGISAARAVVSVIGPSSTRPILLAGKLPAQRRATRESRMYAFRWLIGWSLPREAPEMVRPCRDGADRAERQNGRLTSSSSWPPSSFSPSCHPLPHPRVPRLDRSFRDCTGTPRGVSRGKYTMRGREGDRTLYLGCPGESAGAQAVEKGPDARRRPKGRTRGVLLYVEIGRAS